MSLIRYQTPALSAWPSWDPWSTLRDEMNNLFEGPLWAASTRQTQLFNGWTPALDLYHCGLQRRHVDGDAAESGRGQAKANPSQR